MLTNLTRSVQETFGRNYDIPPESKPVPQEGRHTRTVYEVGRSYERLTETFYEGGQIVMEVCREVDKSILDKSIRGMTLHSRKIYADDKSFTGYVFKHRGNNYEPIYGGYVLKGTYVQTGSTHEDQITTKDYIPFQRLKSEEEWAFVRGKEKEENILRAQFEGGTSDFFKKTSRYKIHGNHHDEVVEKTGESVRPASRKGATRKHFTNLMGTYQRACHF